MVLRKSRKVKNNRRKSYRRKSRRKSRAAAAGWRTGSSTASEKFHRVLKQMNQDFPLGTLIVYKGHSKEGGHRDDINIGEKGRVKGYDDGVVNVESLDGKSDYWTKPEYIKNIELGKFYTAQKWGDRHGVPFVLNDGKTIIWHLLRNKKKNHHYSWYIFPQLAGLIPNPSYLSKKYEIKNLNQAQKFLRDPILGERLRAYTRAVLKLLNYRLPLRKILGNVDARKFRSSMTLFLKAANENKNKRDQELFKEIFKKIGYSDYQTIKLLNLQRDRRRGR
jgi:uncharacterized protein (DUF1810 family)